MKNLRIRKELLDHSMTQGDLAKILNTTQPYVSVIMKYELAKSEQDEIIKAIREYNTEPA